MVLSLPVLPPNVEFPDTPDRSGVLIRDAVFNLLSPLSPDVYLTARKIGMPPLQPDQLPALSVFILGEDGPALGQPNMGIIKYRTDTTIAISVTRGFSDPIYLQGGLETDVQFIKDTLLTNAQFTRRWYGALFESIPSYKSRYVYATEGEAYFGELRLEMVFRFPEVFVPDIEDELKEIDVTVEFGENTGVDLRANYYLWLQQNGISS
jgi:hypothetical protein